MSIWFLCSHKRTTFPITLPERARKVASQDAAPRTYMTCLDCGKEIPYSWEQMKVLPSRYGLFRAPVSETAPLAN